MIIDICQFLVPNAELTVFGNPSNESEYAEQVTWLDSRPQPTWAEILVAKPTVEATKAAEVVASARRAAYVVEADPLFFGWQRGENTEQEWLDKVAEIRAQYPYS